MTALFEHLPGLRDRVAWVSLGELPTPVEAAPAVLREAGVAGELWLKRDDLSSPIYGGNKLRLLEHLLARATRSGATHVYATGATGSNFAIATALHAARVGLVPGAICFPQPMTPEGDSNQRLLMLRALVVKIPHWSLLPMTVERVRRSAERAGERACVLSQVRIEPEALLGYLAAGLELAQQVSERRCPAPTRIVLPIGSAATSAGILAGLSLARRLGLWSAPEPTLCAVRIAAWPLSRRARVLGLAEKLLACAARLSKRPELALGKAALLPLTLITDQLGAGYPHPTPAGRAARVLFARAGLALLDDTYSAKAAAHLLEVMRVGSPGPVLFWCTKSSAPLPVA